MKKVVLAALRKKRGFTHAQLAAECRKHKGGERIGTTHVCAYLSGARPIGNTHFLILCIVLRVNPKNVYTNRYLAGGRQEPVAKVA